MQTIQIRRIAPTDSIEEITALLHRAFAPLGRMGLACRCVDQSVQTTAQRLAQGASYVAMADDHIVGTVSVYPSDRHRETAHYRRPEVASLHQLAVDPQHQGQSIGKALLHTAAAWSRGQGNRELALDTPAQAAHLIDFYLGRGFRIVETVQIAGRDYRSVVLSKPLAPVRRAAPPAWPARRALGCGAMSAGR